MAVTLRTSRAALALLVVVALAIGIANLARPLANPDEGRYSEISREMALSSDWVTPRLDGIKYFEKPPLQYWASAAAMLAFGVNERSARLYVFLCGLATILAAGFTAWRLGARESGLAAMLALVASPYFMALGGIVTLDMGLTLWSTLTICAFLLAERSVAAGAAPGRHRGWMALCWAGLALAVLSKGLVGIVFAGAAVFFQCVLQRDLGVLKRLGWAYGVPILALISAPWFIAVSLANPEFAHFFFVHEHFERFLTTEHRRVEPWWFFLPIVAAGFLPWTFALPAAMRSAWRSEAGLGFQPLRLALLWSAFVLAFFSASGSKLPTYVLPLFPLLALPLGHYLLTAPARSLAARLAFMVPVAAALAFAAWKAPDSAREAWSRAMYVAAQGWFYGAAAALLAATAVAWALLRRERRGTALVVVALGTVLMIGCLDRAYDAFSPRQSGIGVAQAMKPWLHPSTRLYSVNHYDQSLPFYIGRTLTLVHYRDEFATGLDAEPALAIADLDHFQADWLRPGDALAIMQPGTFEKFQRLGLPMQVLHQDPRRVLVRKP